MRRDDTPLHVRVSAAERARMEAAAEKRGLPLSQWVRMTLLDAARALEATP